ncbi:hypothetical protein ACFSKI_21415 [Pseudogracilibacillus auburnensis]|uniref:Uncharacterized protein n=1 Tax=Pseudogracilibacillus auburnensis TaxID=1494959 RepID=A0A2V3VJB6_9BACI|nr:hypothetical protein [Pseudogracilibacillus auburnensis]PXW81640.1 hypothetical protein DFR56_12013 [Pseudogracilibacillus auburnensis]
MKGKLIEKFILILIVNLSFISYNKIIIKVEIEWNIYIFFICISTLAILLLNKEYIDRNVYLFGAIFGLLIHGTISVFLAILLLDLLEKYLMVGQSLYTILYATSNADKDYASINTIIFLSLLTIGVSLAIFSLFIFLFKGSIEFLNYRIRKILLEFVNYYKNNTKIISMCIGLLLVIFGFLPLILDVLDLGSRDLEGVEEEFKKSIFIWILVWLVPYAYFLMKDSKISNYYSQINLDKSLDKVGKSTEKRGGRVLIGNNKRYRLIRGKSTESIVKNRNSWTFTIAALFVVCTICILLLTGKVKVDSATLLSLILAFFSIYLSATFYFKATEQSNNFYNRSYNHTKDIVESLSNMRGEFGKSLNFLEKNSDAMNQRFDRIPWKEMSEKKKKIEKVEKEKEDSIKKMLEEAGVEQSINDTLTMYKNDWIRMYKI